VTGPIGPQGAAGTTSLVSATAVTGSPGAIVNRTSGGCLATGVGSAFLGGTGSQVTNVALGANQVINVTAALDVGLTAGAGNLFLDICYQNAGTGQLVAEPTALGPLALPVGARMPVVLTKAVQPLATGTYTVGICGCVNGTDSWQAGFAWLSAQVLQK